ncbi:MAG: T9SS type A sorting domain-containing protein, partial [Bacteroidota bacterium]
YILGGTTISTSGITPALIGAGDVWIVKTDDTGAILWDKIFGGTDYDDLSVIRQTADGGYIFLGTTASLDSDARENHGGYDMWVVRLDDTGKRLWSKCYGGTDWEFAGDILTTPDGGSIICGMTRSNILNNPGFENAYIIKLDDTGGIQWQKLYGGSISEWANAIRPTSDGGYIVAGGATSTDGQVSINKGLEDYWIFKITSIGTFQWGKTYGGNDADYCYSVAPTPDGGYILAGCTLSTSGDITQFLGSGQLGYGDIWIVKVDDTGKLQWQRSYGGSDDENASTIIAAQEGGYTFSGWTVSADSMVTGHHSYGSDYWIVKIDTTGVIEWQKDMGGSNNEQSYYMVQCTDGGYAMTGYSGSYNFDLTANNGNTDYWLLKIGGFATSIPGLQNKSENVKVYPTFSNGIVHIDLPVNYEHAQLKLINTLGQEILIQNTSVPQQTIDLSSYPQGMYLLQIIYNKEVHTFKLFRT